MPDTLRLLCCEWLTPLETFIGTKKIVEAHIKEVVASLDFVRTATDVPLEEKRAFFRAINKNYGSSALCLSGGASFGYYQYTLLAFDEQTDGTAVSVWSKRFSKPIFSRGSSQEPPRAVWLLLCCVLGRMPSSSTCWCLDLRTSFSPARTLSEYGSRGSYRPVLVSLVLIGRERSGHGNGIHRPLADEASRQCSSPMDRLHSRKRTRGLEGR